MAKNQQRRKRRKQSRCAEARKREAEKEGRGDSRRLSKRGSQKDLFFLDAYKKIILCVISCMHRPKRSKVELDFFAQLQLLEFSSDADFSATSAAAGISASAQKLPRFRFFSLISSPCLMAAAPSFSRLRSCLFLQPLILVQQLLHLYLQFAAAFFVSSVAASFLLLAAFFSPISFSVAALYFPKTASFLFFLGLLLVFFFLTTVAFFSFITKIK
ncbi:hypothetical protein M9H77_28101 [Catharanthus roseus]|uniref:Uncharacterized protein n=1 Tax=Catharanthus roseus TaxID=4058 RepID=A0ACC0AEF1_CATRO|nr:hypothetical protein M9H77_28101 [Catharanthus roseus]